MSYGSRCLQPICTWIPHKWLPPGERREHKKGDTVSNRWRFRPTGDSLRPPHLPRPVTGCRWRRLVAAVAQISGGVGRSVPTLPSVITKRLRKHHVRLRPLPRLGFAGGAAAAVIALAVLGRVPGAPAHAAVTLPAAGRTGSSSGIATHYVLRSGGGNCSYPGPPANHLFVALSAPEYHGAAPCGSYLLVKDAHGSVRVEVIDQCPECKSGHIDLSEAAFAKLAPLRAGIIHVSYRTVKNPPLPGPVGFLVKNGSSQYWLALVVMNTGNAIASVQLKSAAGRWLKLTHANWNAWIAPHGAGPGPFTVRVTDALKHRVTIGHVALKPDVVQRTGTWMYGHH
jgi:expansin (peptidoglycan-binding protein)